MSDFKKAIMKGITTVESPRDIRGWILKMDNACTILGFNDERRLELASVHMCGYLAIWLERKRKLHEGDLTCTSLKVLHEEFVDTTEAAKAQDKLCHLRQQRDETVSKYVIRVRRLIVLSGESGDSSMIIRNFIRGITNRLIRGNVALKMPKSFEDAAKASVEAEAAVTEFGSDGRPMSRSKESSRNHGAPPNRRRFEWKPSSSSQRDGRPDSKKAKGGYAGNRGEVRCYNCGEQGHFKRDCPKLRDAKTHAVALSQEYPNGEAW